jgi:hypothetical protein
MGLCMVEEVDEKIHGSTCCIIWKFLCKMFLPTFLSPALEPQSDWFCWPCLPRQGYCV